jgi:hypothetical protein
MDRSGGDMKTAFRALAMISLVFLSSCATIVSGTQQELSVSCTPRAKIEIKADTGLLVYAGESPAIVELPRKYSYTVTVQAGGYRSQTLIISRQFNAWFLGNLLLGGIVGGVVDAVTGAMWDLKPTMVAVTLEPGSARGGQEWEVVFTSLNEGTRGEALRVPLRDSL